VCEFDKMSLGDPLEAFALGVAIGTVFGQLSEVREVICESHRLRWMKAMIAATTATMTSPFPSN